MTARTRSAIGRALAAISIAAFLLTAVGGTLSTPVPVHAATQALSDNLIAYWDLDETTGTRADKVGTGCGGSGCHLSLFVGAPLQWDDGILGNAFFNDGDGQGLAAANHADLQTGDIDFTVAAWVRLENKTVDRTIITKVSGTTAIEWDLMYNLTNDKFAFQVSNTGTGFSSGVVASNLGSPATSTWYYVVAWHDAVNNTVNIQVNNGTPNSTSYSGGLTATSSNFHVGLRGGVSGQRYMYGRVDEAAFWKRTLTSGERTLLYNGGAGCTHPFTACEATPTPTPTQTRTPTATSFFPTGNLLRNYDFNIAPKHAGAAWTDINRVAQAPILPDLQPIAGLSNGSCGDKYWLMSTGLGGKGEIWQDFGWNGGRMYVNLEGVTNSYSTRGRVTITNKSTGAQVAMPAFSNGTFDWVTFKWVTPSAQPAGQYRFAVSYDGFGPGAGVGIDNVNLRGGYWGNDCPAGQYHGQLPSQGQTTATPVATITAEPPQTGQPVNTNCSFEQGWTGYTRNSATILQSPGGATGPTYGYLFTIYDNGSDVDSTDIVGSISSPFSWPGGQMYVSYFTGPGTRVQTRIRNHATGSSILLQSATTVQSYDGWIKRTYTVPSQQAGSYSLEATTAWGQIAALDGMAVSPGSFASGPCSTANSPADNQATATAHATSSQIAATAGPGATASANVILTQEAVAYATWLAGYQGTGTAVVVATQAAQQTLQAGQTATRSARQTATAQGTPLAPEPTATLAPPTPAPTMNICTINPTWPGCQFPVTVVVDDDLTQIAVDADATATAFAAAVETFWAAAEQTANARASETAAAAQTQAAAVGAQQTATAARQQTATAQVQQTQSAAVNQTAIAANRTATALAGDLNALATAQALATQQAQQANATATAAAQQTELAADPNSTDEAAATLTAVAYATTFTGVTATAQAQATANAQATSAAQATAVAQATANQAATAVSLATQQAGQATSTAVAAATQTQLAVDPEPTAVAQATTTAQAHATTAAQTTATAQAQTTAQVATQIAQGTQVTSDDPELPPVDPRPEPGPSVDCRRPTNPLALADWIDYEVCRILTWFAWSPANTEQMTALQNQVSGYGPFGFMQEVGEVFVLVTDWVGMLPWCETGFCRDQPLTQFNIAASGLLVGDFNLLPGTPYYSDECDLLLEPLVGPGIQRGACFCVNVLCALGILPWFQLLFNIVLAFAAIVYLQHTWLLAAHS